MVVVAISNSTSPNSHELNDKGWRINNGVTIANAAYNSLLTLMTAGKIWWITREARQLMGRDVSTKYKDIVVTIVESGVLYPTALIVSYIVPIITDPGHNGVVPFDPSLVSIIFTGLAPTLIIVRVAHRQSVESVQQMVSTVRFADGVSHEAHERSMPVRSTIALQQSQEPVNEKMSSNVVLGTKPTEAVDENMV
ncbi:hypothetical protein V5O48_007041 [Marasmius crinis-equi]|uniref:Uncharacterized protein n=1 Tax=Marasmius crinis-equi TaxID=585013 RepID=A0ABR3FHZ5_9AGAR